MRVCDWIDIPAFVNAFVRTREFTKTGTFSAEQRAAPQRAALCQCAAPEPQRHHCGKDGL